MDTQRLILMVIFSFSLLMLWEAWQKEHQPVPAVAGSSVPTASAGMPNAANPPGATGAARGDVPAGTEAPSAGAQAASAGRRRRAVW